jgi:small glutamine-rich tetratricopeptide repeat-containing protein alpha
MASQAQSSSSTPAAPSPADKENADKLKQEGNALMSGKKYDEAITSYSKAIAIDPKNPVYYSNRAAAHSSKNDHLAAVGDAEKAISVDPQFVKAYHRLGYAISHSLRIIFLITHHSDMLNTVLVIIEPPQTHLRGA